VRHGKLWHRHLSAFRAPEEPNGYLAGTFLYCRLKVDRPAILLDLAGAISRGDQHQSVFADSNLLGITAIASKNRIPTRSPVAFNCAGLAIGSLKVRDCCRFNCAAAISSRTRVRSGNSCAVVGCGGRIDMQANTTAPASPRIRDSSWPGCRRL